MSRQPAHWLLVCLLLMAACTDQGAPDPTQGGGTGVTLPSTTLLPFAADPPPPGQTVCERYDTIRDAGTVASPALTEVSGIAASRRHAGVLWAHNDSGGEAAIHAVGPEGTDLGVWLLDGVPALDWEDIAIGPGPEPGTDYLYIGDIGDNLAFRPDVMVYRVPEPALDAPSPLVADRIRLAYPSPGIDAEAIAVDPITGDLLVITKVDDGRSTVYRAAADSIGPSPIIGLEPIAELNLGAGSFVTAADITSDGTVIAMRGYEEVWMWSRENADLATAFLRFPCDAPSPIEIQGEALAFAPSGDRYFTVSEGSGPVIFEVTRP